MTKFMDMHALTDISTNQLPDKDMSEYDPPHTKYSHAIDGCNGTWGNCSIQNAACVLYQ